MLKSPNRDGYVCKRCSFSIWIPIDLGLSVSVSGLYDDARFPGRCIVAYVEHVEHFSDMATAQANAFMEDVRQVAKVLRSITKGRINYAILGNVEPHLHMHLIPRVLGGDPVPQRPPWEHPEPRKSMSKNDIQHWRLVMEGSTRSEVPGDLAR